MMLMMILERENWIALRRKGVPGSYHALLHLHCCSFLILPDPLDRSLAVSRWIPPVAHATSFQRTASGRGWNPQSFAKERDLGREPELLTLVSKAEAHGYL